MKLLTRDEYGQISENLKYHIDNKLSITESIFRLGSDAYLDLVNEVRSLHTDGKISLNENDQYIVEKLQTGKKGTYLDKKTGKKITVTLDDPHLRKPSEPSENLFLVYRPNKNGDKDPDTGLVKAVALGFGEKPAAGKPDVRKKHQDEGRRKSFLARHNCSQQKDQDTARWWSCNIHLFWNQLGLKTNDPW